MKIVKISIMFGLLNLITSCNENIDKKNDINMEKVNNKFEVDSLIGKRIFFGHQSVGNNIIGGINSLISENKELSFIKVIWLDEYLKLEIPKNDSICYFIHSGIGKNGYPKSKIEDFILKMNTLKGIDVAFLKFCFVDFDKNTDIDLLYETYIKEIRELEQKEKNTKFIYFTVPPTVKRNFFVKLAKVIMGNPDVSNKRDQFNKKIRETQNISLFDVAYFEAHLGNDLKTIENEYLLKIYALDVGHLNSIGSEKVAGNLLNHLNSLFNK